MRSRSGAGMVSRLLAGFFFTLSTKKTSSVKEDVPVQMNNTRERSTGTSMLWGEETVKSREIEEIEIK